MKAEVVKPSAAGPRQYRERVTLIESEHLRAGIGHLLGVQVQGPGLRLHDLVF